MHPVPPLLTIDIGNSRIKFGLFHDWMGVAPGKLPVPSDVIAITVQSAEFPWDRLQSVLGSVAPVSLVASVNPVGLDHLLQTWPRTIWPEPRVLQDNSELPIVNATQHPAGVGTDRLLKAVAGNVLRTTGQPLILVDCGTATTVDWVSSAGAFAGGAILPGIRLLSQALHDHTALLPLIAPEEFDAVRPAAVGTDTVTALQSGIYWGHLGAIRELIDQMSAEHPGESPQMLITGGAGEMIARDLNLTAGYHPHLTLQGLAVTARSLKSA